MYTILTEDGGYLIVNRPDNSGVLRVPMPKRLPRVPFQKSFEGVFRPKSLGGGHAPERAGKPFVMINVPPSAEGKVDEGPWYVTEFMGDKSRVEHAEMPEDPRVPAFLVPNRLLRVIEPFRIKDREVHYKGSKYILTGSQALGIAPGPFPEYVEPQTEVRERKQEQKENSQGGGGGSQNVSIPNIVKIQGLPGEYKIWKRPGTKSIRVLPANKPETIENTILVEASRVLDAETNQPILTSMPQNPRSQPHRTPPVATVDEAWLRQNVPGFVKGEYYIRAVGGTNSRVYPVAMGENPDANLLERFSFKAPNNKIIIKSSGLTVAETKNATNSQRQANKSVLAQLEPAMNWSEPYFDLFYINQDEAEDLMIDQEFRG